MQKIELLTNLGKLSKPPKDQWEKIELMNYDFQCMVQRCCKCAAHVILGLHVHNKPQTPLTYLQTNANSL